MSVTTGFAGEEASRGVILSLVASVASSHIQFLGLDEQLDAREQLVEALSQNACLAKIRGIQEMRRSSYFMATAGL